MWGGGGGGGGGGGRGGGGGGGGGRGGGYLIFVWLGLVKMIAKELQQTSGYSFLRFCSIDLCYKLVGYWGGSRYVLIGAEPQVALREDVEISTRGHRHLGHA